MPYRQPTIERFHHQLDGTDQILGRLASRAAVLLRGKHKPSFVSHWDMGDWVTIYNAGKIKITGRKLTGKKYFKHTGYIGHWSTSSLAKKMKDEPSFALRRAISGMLPDNRLKKRWLKRLKVLAIVSPESSSGQ